MTRGNLRPVLRPNEPTPMSAAAFPDDCSGDDFPDAGARSFASLRCTEHLVAAFSEARRRQCALDAQEIRLLGHADALIGDEARSARTPSTSRSREIARRAAVADLATSAHISEWTVTRLLGQCADLCERFGPGVDALERAEISRQHLLVIHDAGVLICGDSARAAYLELVLVAARELTPGRLGSVARILAERFLDRSVAERATDAAERRGVEVRDLSDTLAELVLLVPAVLAHAIHDRLTAQARAVVDARPAQSGDAPLEPTASEPAASVEPALDTRTLDQLRADVMTDLLLTGTPDRCIGGDALGEIRATVQISIPVLTMTDQSDEPCLLAGYGPIDSTTARRLAGAAVGWERVMTSPLTGGVLAVDRYRPSSDLKRFLRARDEHCRFPGCRRPVWRCDIDHTQDAARGGATSHSNTAHLCRRHHTLKHESAWSVEQVSPGELVWTSPSGRRHTDRPEPTIRFVLDDQLLARRRTLREPWLFAHEGTAPF